MPNRLSETRMPLSESWRVLRLYSWGRVVMRMLWLKHRGVVRELRPLVLTTKLGGAVPKVAVATSRILNSKF